MGSLIGIIVGIIVLVVLIAVLLFWYSSKKRKAYLDGKAKSSSKKSSDGVTPRDVGVAIVESSMTVGRSVSVDASEGIVDDYARGVGIAEMVTPERAASRSTEGIALTVASELGTPLYTPGVGAAAAAADTSQSTSPASDGGHGIRRSESSLLATREEQLISAIARARVARLSKESPPDSPEDGPSTSGRVSATVEEVIFPGTSQQGTSAGGSGMTLSASAEVLATALSIKRARIADADDAAEADPALRSSPSTEALERALALKI